MCINVACCADVTVTEPLLNLLQAHAIGIEQTGAAMAQIVKADTLHLVCDQKIREMLAQEIGPNPLSHRVYIDIVKIIGAIAFAADLPILLLLLFHFIEHLLTGRDQGKCSAARLCFCLISCDFRYRSVDLCGHNRMLNADFLVLKVNGIPFQTNNQLLSTAYCRASVNSLCQSRSCCTLASSC